MFGEFVGFGDLVRSSRTSSTSRTARVAGQSLQKQIADAKPPVIDFDEIREKVEQLLGGTSVSEINSGTVNMLSQGNFNSSDTITPGDGWSWDGTDSHRNGRVCQVRSHRLVATVVLPAVAESR